MWRDILNEFLKIQLTGMPERGTHLKKGFLAVPETQRISHKVDQSCCASDSIACCVRRIWAHEISSFVPRPRDIALTLAQTRLSPCSGLLRLCSPLLTVTTVLRDESGHTKFPFSYLAHVVLLTVAQARLSL
jgi:hypothetical protein